MEISRTQFFIYLIIGQIVFGLVIGLIRFFLGRSRNDSRMGTYGLAASTAAGILSPLASIIAVAIFSWLIVKKKGMPAASPAVDDFPADNS